MFQFSLLRLLMVLVSCNPAHAIANPSKGDYVGYEGKLNGQYRTEYYENVGYDLGAGNYWFVSHKFTGAAAERGLNHYRKLSSGETILERCDSYGGYGGVREKITVKAGTFDACRVDIGGAIVWYGAVPIWAKLKSISVDGRNSMELVCYRSKLGSARHAVCSR